MIPQLIIAKRLYLEADPYVNRGDAFSAGLAISLLQDSVELYIWALIKKSDIKGEDKSPFTKNLGDLQKAGVKIPLFAKLMELNTARVNFKHYGNLPAPAESRKHQVYVEEFLRAAMTEHFSINFDDLSLVDLVSNTIIRDHLHGAETLMSGGNFNEAATELAKAKTLTFEQMQGYIPSVQRDLKNADHTGGSKPFTYIAEYMGALREASLVAMLHISIEDYAFLRNNLPHASQTHSGKWQITIHRSIHDDALCKRALHAIVQICQRLEAHG